MTGQQTDRMTRDDGWRLLSIGRHLERLGFLARHWKAACRPAPLCTMSGFEAMVALFDSTITFHAQYQQRRDMPPLLNLLVIDRDNSPLAGVGGADIRGRQDRSGCGHARRIRRHGHPRGVRTVAGGLVRAGCREGRHAALEDYLGRCVRG